MSCYHIIPYVWYTGLETLSHSIEKYYISLVLRLVCRGYYRAISIYRTMSYKKTKYISYEKLQKLGKLGREYEVQNFKYISIEGAHLYDTVFCYTGVPTKIRSRLTHIDGGYVCHIMNKYRELQKITCTKFKYRRSGKHLEVVSREDSTHAELDHKVQNALGGSLKVLCNKLSIDKFYAGISFPDTVYVITSNPVVICLDPAKFPKLDILKIVTPQFRLTGVSKFPRRISLLKIRENRLSYLSVYYIDELVKIFQPLVLDIKLSRQSITRKIIIQGGVEYVRCNIPIHKYIVNDGRYPLLYNGIPYKVKK